MNFDELHDPNPPGVRVGSLAAVAGRARTLRRRRAAVAGSAATLAVAGVMVPLALVATGGEESRRLVPATPTSAPELESNATSTTTTPATTTTVAPTTLAPLERPVVVAVKRNGDAVAIEGDGSETVLFDGPDEREQPPEGEQVIVDSVAVMADGRVYVSTCCEPVPGSFFDPAGAEDSVQLGHGLAVSPDGTRLANVGMQELIVRDIDGQTLAGVVDLSDPYAVMWVDDDRIAVLHRPAEGQQSRLSVVTSDTLDSFTQASVEIPVDPATSDRVPVHSFGGVTESGSILVLASDVASTLLAYDPVTLQRRPAEDVVLPGSAINAWVDDGVVSWVGTDDVLHVGDAVLEFGDFRWVRRFG